MAPLSTAAEQAAWQASTGLAYAAHTRGAFGEAVAHQRLATVAALRAPGPGMPDTAWAVMNLARCYASLADLDSPVLPFAARD